MDVHEVLAAVAHRIDPEGAWRRVRYLRHEGTFEGDAERGHFVQLIDLVEARNRYSSMEGSLLTGSGFSGDAFWNVDENGGVVLMRHPGRWRRARFHIVMCELLFIARPEEYGLECETVDEGWRLTVTMPGDEGMPAEVGTAIIDRATHLVREVRLVGATGEERVLFETWKDFGGWLYPTVTTNLNRSGARMLQRVVTLEIDPTVDPAELDAPEPSPGYESFGGRCSIPVRMPHNHVHVPVSIEGVEYDFILDTGAGRTVIASDLAERLELATAGNLLTEGVGGLQPMKTVGVPELAFGSAIYRDYVIASLDLTGIRYGLPTVDGILGLDILRDFLVTLDIGAGECILDPAADEGSVHGSVELVLDVNRAPVAINGTHGMATIDTGAFLPTLHTWFARTQFTDLLSGGNGENLGVGAGGSPTVDVTVDEIRVGPYAIGPVPGRASVAEIGPMSDRGRIATIGGLVWSRLRLTLDLANERMWVTPGRAFDAPIDYHPTGVRLGMLDGEAIIMGLIDDTPASTSGLQRGDEIVAVDGLPIDVAAFEELRHRAEAAPGGQVTVSRRSENGAVEEIRIIVP